MCSHDSEIYPPHWPTILSDRRQEIDEPKGSYPFRQGSFPGSGETPRLPPVPGLDAPGHSSHDKLAISLAELSFEAAGRHYRIRGQHRSWSSSFLESLMTSMCHRRCCDYDLQAFHPVRVKQFPLPKIGGDVLTRVRLGDEWHTLPYRSGYKQVR